MGRRRALAELACLLRDSNPEMRARAVVTMGELDAPRALCLLRRARHDPAAAVRAAAWRGLEACAPRSARGLRRRDEATPVLFAGSLVYWLTLFIPSVVVIPNAVKNLPVPGASSWALYSGIWLFTLWLAGWLAPRLPPPALAWPGVALTAWLLVARWGWVKGGGLLILGWLLSGGLRRKPHLALAALLPYLPLLWLLPATPANVLWITGATLLALALLAILVPRWGRYGADRSAAVALLCAEVSGALGALLAGGDAAAALLLSGALAWGRWWARRPSAYGSTQKMGDLLADIGRAVWDMVGQISPQLKPFLGGVAGALLGALLLRAANTLPGGGPPTWSLSDALWLGAGLGLGLWWAEGKGGYAGSPPRALLWPALSGAVAGALAQGLVGAAVGAGLGLGLGLGEWLSARMETGREEHRVTEE